jgi:putative hydrolase of the HAD superfamily
MLQAVLFDVDDTLYSTSQFARNARLNAVRAMHDAGLAVAPDLLMRELEEVIQEFGSNYDHHFDKLINRVPAEKYEGVNKALLVAAAVIHYHRAKECDLHPFPDVRPIFRGLRDAGLTLGIITDGLRIKQAEKIIRLGILDYLSPNAVFISDDIGISKPNVKLYERALKDLELDPEKVLYVGDNPKNDIDPPNSLGMNTVRVRRGGRHDQTPSETEPNYDINNFCDLAEIIRRDFQVDLPAIEQEERS